MRPINSRTINVVCVCVSDGEREEGESTHQKIDNDASWNMFFFCFVEMKTNLCATCSQRPFGVSSAQPDFPALLLTWHKIGKEERGSQSGVLRWWFELTSWPAANLDLMKYERRPAADTNCNSFIRDTLCCCSSQGGGGVVALIRVPVSRYNWIILCEGVHCPPPATI